MSKSIIGLSIVRVNKKDILVAETASGSFFEISNAKEIKTKSKKKKKKKLLKKLEEQ